MKLDMVQSDIFPQKVVKFLFMTKVNTIPIQLLLNSALIRESQLEFKMNNVEVSGGEAKVGDKVTVSWGGKEYNCKVVDVKEGAVKVQYHG